MSSSRLMHLVGGRPTTVAALHIATSPLDQGLLGCREGSIRCETGSACCSAGQVLFRKQTTARE